MKILKHGYYYLQEQKLDRLECDCGCEFEFSNDDVICTPFDFEKSCLFLNDKLWIHGRGYLGRNVEFLRTIKCPDCGYEYMLEPIMKKEKGELVWV